MNKIRSKIFQNGGSQAVRLPKECRFDAQEVVVYRKGAKVIIEPLDEWPDEFRACIGSWPHDIPRPRQKRIEAMRDPFA